MIITACLLCETKVLPPRFSTQAPCELRFCMNCKYVVANNGSHHVEDSVKIQEARLSSGPYGSSGRGGGSAPRNLSARKQAEKDQQLP